MSAIFWYAVTASGTLDTGTPMSSARDTDEYPGFSADREVMTDFLAEVHAAICFLSCVAVMVLHPIFLAISATVSRSLSTCSGSPSHSTMMSAFASGRGLPCDLLTASMETLSMSSHDAGIRGFAMMAEMQRPAS